MSLTCIVLVKIGRCLKGFFSATSKYTVSTKEDELLFFYHENTFIPPKTIMMLVVAYGIECDDV